MKVRVETLAAFLIVRVAQFLRVTFGEIEPMRRPVGEHKHNTLSEAATVVSRFQRDCVFSPIRRKNRRFSVMSSLSWDEQVALV